MRRKPVFEGRDIFKQMGVDPEAILRYMVQAHQTDQNFSTRKPGDVSPTDVVIVDIAHKVMQHYDNLPQEVREAFPREVVEPAYQHLKNITTVPDLV